jgi:hypothetical protein
LQPWRESSKAVKTFLTVRRSGCFAKRAIAQAAARDLGPQGIHVAHVIVDGVIDTERVSGMMGPAKDDDSVSSPFVFAGEDADIECSDLTQTPSLRLMSIWRSSIDLLGLKRLT